MKADISRKGAHLADLMKTRLHVRGRTLDARLRHAGRMLPRRIRQDIACLAEAERLAESPRLQRRIDSADLDRAYRNSVEYLEAIDPKKRRQDMLLGILASIAFALLVVAALVVVVLIWRGYL